jgi:hypothetical protein
MERVYEQQLSYDMIDLIDPQDKIKIDEYLPFLRCNKCTIVMIEPKVCTTCNLNLCQNCHTKTCTHTLVQSRHLKSTLERLVFKCRNRLNGCYKELKYAEIRNHLLNCQFNMVSASRTDGDDKMTKSALTPPSLKKDSAMDIHDNLSRSMIVNPVNSKLPILCKNCNAPFQDKNSYIEHTKKCFEKEKDANKSVVEEFLVKFNNLQNGFSLFNSDKLKENITLTQKNLNEKLNTIEFKNNRIISLENMIKKFNADESFSEDPELLAIKSEEDRTIQEKIKLQEIYNRKLNEYQEKLKEYESSFNDEVRSQKEKLMLLEVEEKWIKEDMESCVFITDSGVCALCGNSESTVKKFYCQDCSGKYCVNKCAKQCKNTNCKRPNKYICPKDNKACNLCQKYNYCEDCKRKCFYQNCSNSFCPECYKKNEHQARNNNINCKFFTCERDLVCDCLMTSIYCSKCEKRLCNNCLIHDIDHHPFLA